MAKKALLMILDGYGIGNKGKGDVIFQTATPYMDSLFANYPNSQLQASGENVGLPDGQMGNSEVGHLNIGAGRIVYQDLVKINRACADGSILQNPEVISAYEYAKKNGKGLHLMGLTSKVTYKKWDFGMSSRASLNNYVYNAVEAGKSNVSATNIYSGESWHNVTNMVLDKNWQTVSGIDALSDYFIQNASFLKCDNITLGYSFDKLFGRNISGRAYLTAQNVFTITDYKGLDPEINGGYDGNIYPRPFVGIFGLSLNF